jgi:uncharacterized membrane protein
MVASATALVTVYVDGKEAGSPTQVTINAGWAASVCSSVIVPVSAGVHKVDLYWLAVASTLKSEGTRRILTAEEI